MSNKLNTAQAAKVIGVPRARLDRWRLHCRYYKQLTPVYEGRTPYYDAEQVEEFKKAYPELQKSDKNAYKQFRV